MTTWLSLNSAMYSSWKLNSRYSRAPSTSSQLDEMPHCQEPPPIFGPSPKSGGGQDQQVVTDRLDATSSAFQTPV